MKTDMTLEQIYDTLEQIYDEAFELLQYATYHDGRYDQFKTNEWQERAQKLVVEMAKQLGRKPYDGFGPEYRKQD